MTVQTDRYEEMTGRAKLRLFVDRSWKHTGGFRFALFKEIAPDKVEEAHFELRPIERNEELGAGFVLSPESMQELIDQLWALGLRPTNVGDFGQVAKTQEKHLDDLRRIAFHVLKMGKT